MVLPSSYPTIFKFNRLLSTFHHFILKFYYRSPLIRRSFAQSEANTRRGTAEFAALEQQVAAAKREAEEQLAAAKRDAEEQVAAAMRQAAEAEAKREAAELAAAEASKVTRLSLNYFFYYLIKTHLRL